MAVVQAGGDGDWDKAGVVETRREVMHSGCALELEPAGLADG